MARKNKIIDIKFNKNDYDMSLLPNTRRSQFKDIITHNFRTIFLMGAWLLIFFLPILVFESSINIFLYTYIEQNTTTLTPEEMKSFEFLITVIRESALVAGYMIFSIGVAGALRLTRNLVYGEVIFFKNDFIEGIKKYWKLCLLSAFTFAFFKGATNVLSYVVRSFTEYNHLYILSGFAIGFFYAVIVPVIYFYISIYITYDVTFKKCLGLALRFYISNLLVALAFSAFLFALTFIWYIGILLVVDIILIVLMLFASPIYILLWHLYATSKFDKYINKNQFPEVYRKGLQKGE